MNGVLLQASVLKTWASGPAAAPEAQRLAAALAAANSAAARGCYSGPHPSARAADGGLREAFRGWEGGDPAVAVVP